MINSFLSRFLVFFFFLFSFNVCVSQISGPTYVVKGEITTYSIPTSTSVTPGYWSWNIYLNGVRYRGCDIMCQNSPYSFEVLWEKPGTYQIEFYYLADFSTWTTNSFDLDITVLDMDPIIQSSTCGQSVLQRQSNPPAGKTWYWQGKSSYGVSTNLGSGSTFVANQGSGTYYLRSRDADGTWAATSGSVYVSIMEPITWYQDTDGDGLGNPNNTIVSCAQPIGYVDNDGTLPNENYIRTISPNVGSSSVAGLTSDQKIEAVTYYDGLGRPKQTVGVRSSGVSGRDIITDIEYDDYGRQSREYLAYSAVSNGGIYRSSANMSTRNFYNSSYYENTLNPYSEKLLEASPLSRVLKQAAPGADWKLGNGHEIKLDYQTNISYDVKNFKASLSFAGNTYTPTLTQSTDNNGYYNANELYKTVTYDENTADKPTELNGSTVEFKNKQGQVILKRTYGTVGMGTSNEKYDTYYVYDDYGNLSFVLPPKVNTNYGASQTELDELCYQYKYDQRKRLVEKKLPGKQWEFIVYDNLDRVVATGPAASPFSDLTTVGWLITKYDAFSRPVLTAWYPTTVTSATRTTLQNSQNGYTTNFNETKIATTSNTTVNGVAFRYNNVAWPTSGYHVLTVNYYDDYNYPNAPTIAATVEGEPVYFNSTIKPKGLPTGSWIRTLQTSTTYANELSYTFYDKKARPIRTHSTNFLGGYTYTDSKLDFTGKPEYIITHHKRLSEAELKTKDAFTYSPQGRLLTQTHQIGTGTVELIASNQYDELGQLVSKKVGNTTSAPTQNVNYTYNIRGWLKGINNTGALQQGTDPKDLFAFAINYNTPSASISGVNALYNGNISETQWATNSDNGILRTYGYKYDNLNRLREGIYKKQSSVSNAYNESMTYDKNGNIMSLLRNGNNESTATAIDNLTYSYGPTNQLNRLTKVDDSRPNTTGLLEEFKDNGLSTDDYTYDANGNMLKDLNKGIGTSTTDGITYNHLNLPTTITFGTAGNIVYIYNALGQKVQKVFNKTGQSAVTTDYLGGYQYNNAVLKFFPTAEGYVEPSGSSYKYVYQYKDHLGNVRLSYDKTLAVQEENDYYPFGLEHTGYGYSQIVNSDYKYKYNGKELQDELGLNFYDFGFRNYDSTIGRWMNIDPLAEKRYDLTTYNYVQNSPLFRFDPNGLTDFTLNKKNGDVKEVKKSDDPDRILKTNRKGEVKYNKKGEAKVAVGGIERGILKDGQNFKNKDQIINVGGEGQPSVGGVKDFTLKLSEYVGKEIKGFSYSSDASGNVTDMVLGKYNDNLFDKSFGDVRELQKKYGDNYSNNNISQQFHTHPNGQLGATQSNPELSQDIKSLQGQKPLIPNASFIILYRITGQAKPAEYDYTSEYKP